MNKKQKFSMKTTMRYLRDLSIVVAGIAVTLYVNDKVTNQGEKRDLKLYLNAIKMELEENIKIIDDAIEVLQPSLRYAEYLVSHPKDSLNKDTIVSRFFSDNAILTTQTCTFKTNAFDMFKSSGVMRLVNDKDLLLSLWDMYDYFNVTKEIVDWNFKTKWEDVKKELSTVEIGKDNDSDKPPLYSYHIIGVPGSLLNTYEEVLRKTKEMVLMLENELK